ncbi:alcohol oxidase [Epithele typhae]|uniref:alcohol oxidase n=1 Tax=Epithele typhae TaxID=378194 RepID=UPI0020076C77|nr:alcohol oxidase [Epithele typhae]KAH9943228.1 alcohol oxidase [Epithele typhae]
MTASINDVKDKAFDYIICGGGTAGLTIAARLTEDPNVSVLVLEAGQTNIGDDGILRLSSYGSHFGNPNYAWDFKTTPQANTGNTCHGWQRGKGLGGSSQINFLVHIKPPAEDVDAIERLGNPGWNWKNLQKYIHRAEGFVPPGKDSWVNDIVELKTADMGTDGPLAIAFPAFTFINAGIPVAPRPYNGQPHGAYLAPSTIDPKTHTRSYATTAYYLPNRHRSNLTVLVMAHVNRVVPATDAAEFVAEAVEFEYEGRTYVVPAKKEVILCAGTLKSPHILELSGIGNPNLLRKLGITPKVDLPGVGSNVQEHMVATISFEVRDDVDFQTLDCLADPAIAAKHLELRASGKGLFTNGIVNFAFATLGQISSKANAIIEATEDKVNRMSCDYPPGILEQHKITIERLKNGVGCEFIALPAMASRPNPPEAGKRYITLYSAMNHTMSRGTIHTASKDASVEPHFDPRYFEEEVDLQVFLEMVKFSRSLASVAPLKDMIVKELNPGPDVQSDEALVDWLKQTFTTTWHTAGSCSMLPKVSGGVVDPELKVYGAKNLRVVDLSILPLHVACHTQAVVYGIAEQASDIIKGAYKP